MARILILGSGGFGVSLAVMLHKYNHNVCMWSKFPQEIADIRRYGENRKLLPGVPIDLSIELTDNMADGADASLPFSPYPRLPCGKRAKALGGIIRPNTIVANVAKGFEESTHLRLSQVIAQEIPHNPIVILSGAIPCGGNCAQCADNDCGRLRAPRKRGICAGRPDEHQSARLCKRRSDRSGAWRSLKRISLRFAPVSATVWSSATMPRPR